MRKHTNLIQIELSNGTKFNGRIGNIEYNISGGQPRLEISMELSKVLGAMLAHIKFDEITSLHIEEENKWI